MSIQRFIRHPLGSLLALGLFAAGAACNAQTDHAHMHHHPPAAPGSFSAEQPARRVSADGRYRVSVHTDQNPIPLQRIHSWFVHVETAAGVPVENARIYVHGGMPAHRHGFPTKPRVTEHLGNGDYRIDGMKFSMPGRWELRLNIKEQTRRDRVVFDIDL